MKPTDNYISKQELYNYFHDKDAPNNITEVRLGGSKKFREVFSISDSYR